MIRDSKLSWGSVSRLFHWSGAVLVIALLAHGTWMTDFAPRTARLFHYGWHGELGYALLFLLLLRIGWRFLNPTPELPVGTTKRAEAVARATHALLYLLMLAACVSGWVLADTFGGRLPPTLFGVIPLPTLIATPPRGLHDTMEELHGAVSHVLMVVALLHVAAAFWHHFVKHDDVLTRMARAKH